MKKISKKLPKTVIVENDTVSQSLVKELVSSLSAWFTVCARKLPWRSAQGQARNPYHVWISEVMLQQTQMERGVEYFLRWMQRFPTIEAVAHASEEAVLHAWEGLGYYSRARHIHKAAKIILQDYDGIFPAEVEHIRALPGIGPYTAGAIASMAFGYALPCIDANVERVLSRLFDVDTPVKQEPAATRIRALALQLALAVPQHAVGAHNEALMELGALVCRKKPLCPQCPWQKHCESHRLNIVKERPVPGKRTAITPLVVVTGVLVGNACQEKFTKNIHQTLVNPLTQDCTYFLQKRLPQGAWASLWEFPGGRVEVGESPEQAIVREFKEETGFDVEVVKKYGVINHGYTTYRITLHCFALRFVQPQYEPEPILTAATAFTWAPLTEIQKLALPAAHRKLADMLVE